MENTNNTQEVVDNSWIIDKMNQEELKIYLKAQLEMNRIQKDIIANLSERCDVYKLLLNNYSDDSVLVKKFVESSINVAQMDNILNEEYGAVNNTPAYMPLTPEPEDKSAPVEVVDDPIPEDTDEEN